MKEFREGNEKTENISNTESTIRRDSYQDTKQNLIINFKINHILNFNLIVHNSTREEFNIKVVNDIIYNENKRIVSKFKDHLIYNDPAEFLRRFYPYAESSEIITQWGSFFDEESLIKLVPNYSIVTPKKLLLRNIRKKLKLREKLRRTYYDENDEYEGNENYNEKKNKPAYSRFFLTNLDLKEYLQDKSSIDLNFGLVDDADRSRFFSMNNYVILNSNYQNYNFLFDLSNDKNSIRDDNFNNNFEKKLKNSVEEDEKAKMNKFKKYFYDNNAKFVFSTGFDANFIRKNILRNNYKIRNQNIDEISEMQMGFSESKFLETSLNFNNMHNDNSEKKNESLTIEENINTATDKNAIMNDFMHKGGVYEIKYDENKKQSIVKISDKKANKEQEQNDFLRKTENKENAENNNFNIRGIYSNFEFDNEANLRPGNFLNQIMTTESLGLKEDADFNLNFVITNHEEKNDLITSNNKDLDMDRNLRSEFENKNSLSAAKLSRKASAENEKLKEDLTNKLTSGKKHFNNHKDFNEIENSKINSYHKSKNSYKTIQEDEENNKNNSKSKYIKQKSLERNQSTKNLLLDGNYLKRLSKDYDYENNDLNVIMENESGNKLINKDSENNYYNIQTRKSLKKNNDLLYNPQKPVFNLYPTNNKFKKNPNLNRNISGSPSNRLNNLNSNDPSSNKDNYRNYYESKLYKEKKDRNAKIITNKNRLTEKDKSKNRDSKKNMPKKNPFKLASEFDSNIKKKSFSLNRVQSVQDLHGEKMQIDKSLFDSKEKKSVILNSKSLVKNKSMQKIESNVNKNRISDSNKYTDRKFQKNNESKKSPFTNDSNTNIREGSYTKSYSKTIINNNNNNNNSYRESKNQNQAKDKNNDSKANISNNKSSNKQITKFKSNPKIENSRNLNINFSEKWNSSSILHKSSSAAKITRNTAGSKIRGNSNLEKENLDASRSFYKNNENSRTKNNQSKIANENEENSNNNNNSKNNLTASLNAKVNNFADKHKRAYSDFSTPSPIIKKKPKAITTNNFKNNNTNINTRKTNETSKGNNNKSNNFNNNKFYLGDRKNIQSEKALNKGKLNIFESNNFSKQNNLETNQPNSQINFSNLNSKEANQTIQREDELRSSNNFENNIVNKNIINYDFTFKNIPIFDNIEAKQKILMKQNSHKNPDTNYKLSNLANTMKNGTNNLVSNNNSEDLLVSQNKANINGNDNLKYDEIMQSNSNKIEEANSHRNNFNNTINKYAKDSTAAYSNLNVNNLHMNFFKAKTLNVNNKLENPNLDNYINSPSATILNKELSINLLSDRKENSELLKKEKTNEIIKSNDTINKNNNNKIKENLNDGIANDLTKNKSYKIIDTVHLNKFLNSRSNNLNINSLNIKPKTTTIANFVSISNQENMKFNLNKNETNLNSNNNSINNTNNNNKPNQKSLSSQMNSTPIKQKQDNFLNKDIFNKENHQLENKNINQKTLFRTINIDADNKTRNTLIDYVQDSNINADEKEKLTSYNRLTPSNNSNSTKDLNVNLNSLLASNSDVNNFNKNFNPNNFKNRVFFIGSNNKNTPNSSNNNLNSHSKSNNNNNYDYNHPKIIKNNHKDDNSTQDLKMKKSESSNFYSKTTKLNENSSIENCLQITADNFSKRSNDNASSNQMKNSLNNFAISNIIQNEISEYKSSNASKINLLSINSKNKETVSLPFKVENNSSSINNSKITSNSLNSLSNNSINKNSNLSNNSQSNCRNKNENKDGIIDVNYLTKKALNSDVNNFNKNNAVGINLNPYYKGILNANFKNEKLFNCLDEIENKKTCIEEKFESNNNMQKQAQNMHKKTKSSDFNASKEKYSNKFINTNNKTAFYKNENNLNSNKNFISNKITNKNNNNNIINRGAVALSDSTNNIMNINEKNQPNVFISTNIPSKTNPVNNSNGLNPRHRKNSYSHAFISYAGNQQNNYAVNLRNSQNTGNIANFNNYNNNQNKVKVTSKIESKEKERIILNFSSNNSSNLNFNNISKNLNENTNHLLISPFAPSQRNSSSRSILNSSDKIKGNINANNLKK